MDFANPVDVPGDRLIIVGPTALTTSILLYSAITKTSVTAAETQINAWLATNITDRGVLCRVKSLAPFRLSFMAYDLGNPRAIDLPGWTG